MAGKLDPDYEGYASAREQTEEEDKREKVEKIRKIIEEEYNKEIMQRQDQIEQIELHICKVRKLLHLLRYVLIMSYYKKNELEYSEEEPSTSEVIAAPEKQGRIHPAVKKLLGKNCSIDHLTIRDKRKSTSRHSSFSKPSDSPDIKKIKLDPDVNPPLSKKPPLNHTSTFEDIRSRKKTKHRLVVGNISKFMPSSEEDNLTHKWMVYIRGPKDKADISDLVEKVIFYLHPSYKPHDVVEVNESPFHLSRRGWGEFPVRVQIFFKVKINKPIDVIHNIKLDKTYTGRQTLGNETVVDVFLYDDKPLPVIKQERSLSSSSVEHDYCTDTVPTTLHLFDHPYCLPSEDLQPIKSEKVEQDDSNTLIYGLEKYMESGEMKNNCTKVISAQTLNQLIELARKDLKFSNARIIVLEKKVDGVSKVIHFPRNAISNNRSEEGGSYSFSFPRNRLKNMGEALTFLFKRLPLYSELAKKITYKRLYPFAAASLKEFVSWNVGRRRSAEWSRASMIKKILTTHKVHGAELWNTKSILMFGRSHDYSPFVSFGLFTRESQEKNLISSCFSSLEPLKRAPIVKQEEDQYVNVDSDEEETNKPKSVIDIVNSAQKLEYSFVRHASLESGVILRHEEVEEGVRINGAEIVLLEAVKCLAENLIRRAKCHRVCTKVSADAAAITREDVEVALNERAEMTALLHFKKRNNFFRE